MNRDPITTNRQEQTMPVTTARAVAQALGRSPDELGVDRLAADLEPMDVDAQAQAIIDEALRDPFVWNVQVVRSLWLFDRKRASATWTVSLLNEAGPNQTCAQGTDADLRTAFEKAKKDVVGAARRAQDRADYAEWKADRDALRKATDEIVAPLVEKYADNGEAVAGTLPLANGDDGRAERFSESEGPHP